MFWKVLQSGGLPLTVVTVPLLEHYSSQLMWGQFFLPFLFSKNSHASSRKPAVISLAESVLSALVLFNVYNLKDVEMPLRSVGFLLNTSCPHACFCHHTYIPVGLVASL